MKKTSSLVIVILITSGMFVQINPIFAPSHPEFAGQHTVGLYTRGTIDQSSPFAGESIRTILDGDSATVIHPGQGIEIVRMSVKSSDVCIQTQSTVCIDAIVTSVTNTHIHQIGDELSITFDLANKKQVVTVNSGPMRGTTFIIDLSKIMLKLNGPYMILFTQEGGFAGMQNNIMIDTQTAQLIKSDVTVSLDENSVKMITKEIKKTKFFDIEKESYPPIEGSADYFTYLVQITQGPIQKTISWTDASENVPEKLNVLKDAILNVVSDSTQISEPAPDVLQADLAIDFVKNALTFAFDGIDDSLIVEDVMILESFPVQYIITINFESLHGGYGDRTGQFLTQAITPHTIRVTVVDGQITSAIIDDVWNEINQEMLGGHFDDDTIGEFWGSIYGMVLLGPTCPVVSDPPDPECADKPYQTHLVVTTADQSYVIKEFSSDADGKFYVDVPPGEYAIRSAAASNILPYCSSDATIEVDINSGVEVTVFCDTGIR